MSLPGPDPCFVLIFFDQASKSEICDFHNIVLSNKHISSCKISANMKILLS